MNNKIRNIVKDKFDGLCAFCGYELTSGCHIWDIKPIITVINKEGELEKLNTDIDNLIPACKACNGLRGTRKLSIEEFRNEVQKGFEFLRTGGITASAYGRALRFGQIIETNNPIIFHFEKVS